MNEAKPPNLNPHNPGLAGPDLTYVFADPMATCEEPNHTKTIVGKVGREAEAMKLRRQASEAADQALLQLLGRGKRSRVTAGKDHSSGIKGDDGNGRGHSTKRRPQNPVYDIKRREIAKRKKQETSNDTTSHGGASRSIGQLQGRSLALHAHDIGRSATTKAVEGVRDFHVRMENVRPPKQRRLAHLSWSPLALYAGYDPVSKDGDCP